MNIEELRRLESIILQLEPMTDAQRLRVLEYALQWATAPENYATPMEPDAPPKPQ